MYQLTGRHPSGTILARDQTDLRWKAKQIAAEWRASGLQVEIVETAAAMDPKSAGIRTPAGPRSSILGHSGASLSASSGG
ncbi:MAG TPA: hypothetical protein VMP01_05400 [Pirellulaceae bacterium]|nr:hypothetical protein [Pirellulaceae bacterium]